MKITHIETELRVLSVVAKETIGNGRTVELHTDKGLVLLEINRRDILQLTQALLYTAPGGVQQFGVPNE